MYLLFQQQTTIERAAEDNAMWGPVSKENPSHLASWSLLRMFGPTTALVVPDSRAGELPACLPACLPGCLPVSLPTFLSPCLPSCLPACLPGCLPACLPACLPGCLPAFLPACLPACLAACLPACLPSCLPSCLPACFCVSMCPVSQSQLGPKFTKECPCHLASWRLLHKPGCALAALDGMLCSYVCASFMINSDVHNVV